MWGGDDLVLDPALDAAIADGHSYQAVNWPMVDAIFNAFSRDAIERDHLLPYNVEVEKQSWWNSQLLVQLRALCKYGRSASTMATTTILPDNPLHRDYPRLALNMTLPDIVQAVSDLADPVKCPMARAAGAAGAAGGR